MCGIVGFLSFNDKSISVKAEEVFKQLLLVDQLRGSDSTGIGYVSHKLGSSWFKSPENSTAFLDRKDVIDFFSKMPSNWFVVGHNRSATFGTITANNAHPFETPNLLGVHNGTVSNYGTLVENGYKYDVDSQAVLNAIDVHGIDDVVQNAKGAYALVYANHKTGDVTFIRNKERPMFHVYTKIKKYAGGEEEYMFFGSEIGMLTWVLQRNGFEITKVVDTEVYKEYTFAVGIKEPTERAVEPPKVPVVYGFPRNVHYNSRYSYYDDADINYDDVDYQVKPRLVTAHKPVIIVPTKDSLAPENNDLTKLGFTELVQCQFLNDKDISGDLKRQLITYWRQSNPGRIINFQVTDMTEVPYTIVDKSGKEEKKVGWKIFGKLAGKVKKFFPIEVTATVTENLIASCSVDAILRGKVRHKLSSNQGRNLYFELDDVELLHSGGKVHAEV